MAKKNNAIKVGDKLYTIFVVESSNYAIFEGDREVARFPIPLKGTLQAWIEKNVKEA